MAVEDLEVAAVLDFSSLVAAASAVHQSRRHCCAFPADAPSAKEVQNGQEVLSTLMAALGPDGPGLVAVTGVPHYERVREELLPRARDLALMPRPDQIAVLKDNGLGTDVPLKTPNRAVSSFAAQLQFHPQMFQESLDSLDVSSIHSSPEQDGTSTGSVFRQLGLRMVKLGLLVASLCDVAIDGAGLESAILSAGTAKGRLIHYHSVAEQHSLLSLDKSKRLKGAKRSSRTPPSQGSRLEQDGSQEISKPIQQDWQDWHFDYGVFTVLTAPMFCKLAAVNGSDDNSDKPCMECVPSPCGHSLLRILHAPSNALKFMDISPDCLVIQVGEAAQILSGGKLRATAHCVCRPPGGEVDISRETFAVFLQPSWDKALVPPPGFDTSAVLQANADLAAAGFSCLNKVIPSLSSRWTQGCTFADFARNTTRQYYGAAGRQHTSSS